MKGQFLRVTWGMAVVVVAVCLLLGATQWRDRPLPVMAGSMVGRVLVVDPGHGGPDPGSIGPGGTLEKDIVLSVSRKLGDYLTLAGTSVVLTRTDDVDLSGMTNGSLATRKTRDIRARMDMINNSDADVAIIIHANATVSSRWRGAQTFYSATSVTSEESKRLARTVQEELRDVLKNTNRVENSGVEQYLLEQAAVPVANVEIGFLSNPDEERLLTQDEYQRRVAWAIFLGVARFFAEGALPAAAEGQPEKRAENRCLAVWATVPLAESLESRQPNPLVSLLPGLMCGVGAR